MARTPSNMLDLGTQAPNFTLLNSTDGKSLSFADVHGTHGTVVMFICNHCPFVKHVFDGITSLAKDYQNKEWSEEKEKLDKAKNKVNKVKEKVLNQ